MHYLCFAFYLLPVSSIKLELQHYINFSFSMIFFYINCQNMIQELIFVGSIYQFYESMFITVLSKIQICLYHIKNSKTFNF